MTLLSSGHPDKIREQAILSLPSIPPFFILHLKLAKGKNICKKMPVHEIFFCRESKS